MKRLIVSAAVFAASVAALPSAARAQVTTPGTREPGTAVTAGHGAFYLSPYAGYIAYGDLSKFSGGATLSNKDGGIYGVQAGYSFSPNFALLANAGYNKSKFTFEQPGSGTTNNVNLSGNIGVFLYDADVQFRLPIVANRIGSTIAPFAQLGAGAIRYTLDADNFNSKGATTNVAFTGGLGVDFQVQKYMGIRLLAKDYVTSLAFKELDDVDNAIRADKKLSNNFAITAGLNFGF